MNPSPSRFGAVGVALLVVSCATPQPPALHVIGVYEGVLARPIAARPLPKECSAPGTFATRMERKEYLKECAQTQQVDQTRTVKVLVSDTSRPIVLGLMAYSKTEWVLEIAPSVVIQRVIVGGYHTQTVTGLPQESTVEMHTYESSPCERCVQLQPYFYSYERVPVQMEQAAGLKASSFQSRYDGESFSIFKGM